MIPTTIVDDFLDQPDEWREYAQQCAYKPTDGRWPGFRSESLYNLNPNMAHRFMDKFLSIFYEIKMTPVTWNGNGSFQKVPPNSGAGWVHRDTPLITAILYLNKDANPNAGTSLYKPKPGNIWEMKHLDVKKAQMLGQISAEDAEPYRLAHNEQFINTVTVKNQYNRLLAFDGNIHHAADELNVGDDDRLTLVFFITSISAGDLKLPSVRMQYI